MKSFIKFLKIIVMENPASTMLACVIGAIAVLCSTGLFGLSAYLIALSATHPGFEAISLPVVGVRFFGIARAAFRYLERLVSHDTTFKILRNLRVKVYGDAEPLLPDYRQKLRREDVVARLVSDVENLQEAFLRIIYPYLSAFLVLLAGMFILWLFNPLLALAFGLLYSLTVFVVPVILNKYAKGVWAEAASIKQELFRSFLEFSYGLAEILSNRREAQWENKLEEILDKDLKQSTKAAASGALSNSLAYMFPALSMWSCLAISCWLVSQNKLPGVMVAIAPLASSALFEAVQPILLMGVRFEKSSVSAQRVFGLKDRPPTAPFTDDTALLGNELVIENLGFSYTGNEPVIEGFNLSLKPGEIKALVGPSGVGKSTVINIILGFLDGYSGKVQMDGADQHQIPADQWRKYFSVVDQKPFLFNTTLRENMRIANPMADDKDIFNALSRAGVAEFVHQLPQGLDTVIAELGSNLSGGELQRLGIARALLKDAPFFLFDEPTEGLDTVNEKNIMELILELSQRKGVLLITHKKHLLDRLHQIYRL